jgi:hypothetical protein
MADPDESGVRYFTPMTGTVARSQKLGCPASLHDHMRNEVEVRSMAGSVVLYDCMLS